MARLLVVLILTLGVLGISPVSAAGAPNEDEEFSPKLSMDYLWDGGALPFVYGSALFTLGVRLFIEPPETPRFFAASEGGASISSDTIPEIAMAGFALSGAGLIAAIPGPSRWYHLKGYAQATMTTLAITEIAKNVVGRHRPTFSGDLEDTDSRRSFFSGHASVAATSSVYLGLYLGLNILPRLPPTQARVYGALGAIGLATVLVGVPLSRLDDNRHHLSDVLAGSFVGAASAITFYTYQQMRYQRDRDEFRDTKQSRFMLVPDVQNRGVVLFSSW
ncbi:MAG: phosphatase PAP2 family protein [Kofleriaceae bacterium]|nr:phosphatase PAP2 family protein [Kofleriaceae bacterium]